MSAVTKPLDPAGRSIMGSMICALLNDRTSSRTILGAADQLADLVGHLQISALAIRAEPSDVIGSTEDMLSEDDEQKIRAEEDRRVRSLHWAFKTWLANADRADTPCWIDREGNIKTLIKGYGKTAAYFVAGQPGGTINCAEKKQICAALFQCGKPVLVTPPRAQAGFGRSVAMIWRGYRNARDIISAAMPIFSQADEIHVLVDSIRPTPDILIAELFATHRARLHIHRPRAGFSLRNAGATVLDIVRKADADLLVMNACAKPTWPMPFLYGSATEFILKNSTIPILLGR
ncbi:adenine nucleotide alpha hydrolase family protein [Acidiphilium acidophilum]|uniref:UspA domain-containing protein n=1 Tax=Acidiphilium acidophilum TaxID=76588 RepID=A0AAW9DRC0_ACIAO|nr:hypothetical protein [Acidiphilium acidophilum]MDX5931614.1 hypothetical protein [Acidiphilium acidophilum]